MEARQPGDRRARILIVEDVRHIARLLQFQLERAGFETCIASDVARARVALEEFRPDAVLLDVVLPDGSGLDLCRSLLAAPRDPQIVVCVMSAHAFDAGPGELAHCGAHATFTKPISPLTLLQRLADLGVGARPPVPGGVTTG